MRRKKYHPIVNVFSSEQDNLTKHVFSIFMPRPAWRYNGAPRNHDDGSMKHQRAFSVKQISTLGFPWLITDQAWAVSEGFFLHRSGQSNQVNIIGVDPFIDPTGDPLSLSSEGTFPYGDSHACLVELERRNMLAQRRYGMALVSPTYRRALRFIRQQDEFGYSGAWDKEVQFFSSRLEWYKHDHARSRAPCNRTPHDRIVLARIKQLAVNAARARWHRPAARARRVILES